MLKFEIEPEAVGGFELRVERNILGLRLGVALEAGEFGRQAAPWRSTGIAGDLGQGAGLEDAVLVEGPIGSGTPDREARIIVDQRLDEILVGEELGFRPEILDRGEQASVAAFELADRGEGLAIALQIGGAHTGPLGHDHRAGRREVAFVEIDVPQPGRADVLHANAGGIQTGIPVTGILQLRGIGPADELGLRIAELEAEHAAPAGGPGVRDDPREARRPFLRQIAVIRLDRAGDVQAGIIERLARHKIDGAGDPAIDQVGGGVFVDLDAAEEFGRHIVEREHPATGCGKDVAAVEFGADVGKPANDDAGAFDREPVGIGGLLEPADVDARNALQRLGDRAIGERANVFRGDDVDDGIGAAFDLLRGFERGAKAGDHDHVLGDRLFGDGGFFLVDRRRFLRQGGMRRDQRQPRCGRQDGDAASRTRNSGRFPRHVSSPGTIFCGERLRLFSVIYRLL